LEQLEGYEIDITFVQEFQDDAINRDELNLIRAIYPELMQETLLLTELEKE